MQFTREFLERLNKEEQPTADGERFRDNVIGRSVKIYFQSVNQQSIQGEITGIYLPPSRQKGLILVLSPEAARETAIQLEEIDKLVVL